MCNIHCITFGARELSRVDIQGKRVLEVGSYSVNGSLRALLSSWAPSEYVGVDISAGPGVDIVCPGEKLIEQFSPNAFDVVISTEMLEHAREWRAVIHHMKSVCKPEGIILLTTRSLGFPYHAHPHDFWRYQVSDMREIFSDCEILTLESEPGDRGVFIKARKPKAFTERSLNEIELYSIIANRRLRDLSDKDYRCTFYVGQLLVHHVLRAAEGFRRLMSRGYRRIFRQRPTDREGLPSERPA